MKTKPNRVIALLIALAASLLAAAPASARDFRASSVCAHSQDEWTLTLTGGSYHQIEVDGDGDTDLDFFLYDEGGNLVDSDTDGTDYCALGVRPRWTGRFTLVVVNHGPVFNRYTIAID